MKEKNNTMLTGKIVMQMSSTEKIDNLQYHQFIHYDVALGNKNESVPQQQAIPSEIITDEPLIPLR